MCPTDGTEKAIWVNWNEIHKKLLIEPRFS
jgi:hypothetical protein